jgi:hypothetical protein
MKQGLRVQKGGGKKKNHGSDFGGLVPESL